MLPGRSELFHREYTVVDVFGCFRKSIHRVQIVGTAGIIFSGSVANNVRPVDSYAFRKKNSEEWEKLEFLRSNCESQQREPGQREQKFREVKLLVPERAAVGLHGEWYWAYAERKLQSKARGMYVFHRLQQYLIWTVGRSTKYGFLIQYHDSR